MFKLLEKLRNQSKAQRTFIAFSLSLLFTGVVFVMWLMVEKNAKNGPEAVPTSNQVTQNSASNTPTDTLLKNVQDMWGSLVGASAELSETVKNVDFSSTLDYNNSSTSQQ